MGKSNSTSRKLFGLGAYNGNQPTANWRAEDQDVGETLAVGTIKRKFKGPQDATGTWSFDGRMSTAGGAGSQLKFYYSNLPDPDPTNTNHWTDSGITAVALTATTPFHQDVTGKFPEWILAEVTIGTSGGVGYLWVRSSGVEV